jgi:hypothetical protein
MIEVYCPEPGHESQAIQLASAAGGRLDYREESLQHRTVCLTFDFRTAPLAEQAAEKLRGCAFHVEGPCDYGD